MDHKELCSALPRVNFFGYIHLSLYIPSIRNKVTFKAISEKLYFPPRQTPTPQVFVIFGVMGPAGASRGRTLFTGRQTCSAANPALVSLLGMTARGFAFVIKKKPLGHMKQMSYKNSLSMLALVRAVGGGRVTPHPRGTQPRLCKRPGRSPVLPGVFGLGFFKVFCRIFPLASLLLCHLPPATYTFPSTRTASKAGSSRSAPVQTSRFGSLLVSRAQVLQEAQGSFPWISGAQIICLRGTHLETSGEKSPACPSAGLGWRGGAGRGGGGERGTGEGWRKKTRASLVPVHSSVCPSSIQHTCVWQPLV